MKQQVKRLTLTGNWEEVQFDFKAICYFVKNYSNGDIFVSFEENDSENTSFKIKSGMGEEVAISYAGKKYKTDTLYVKGTGEVEVQQLDFN